MSYAEPRVNDMGRVAPFDASGRERRAVSDRELWREGAAVYGVDTSSYRSTGLPAGPCRLRVDAKGWHTHHTALVLYLTRVACGERFRVVLFRRGEKRYRAGGAGQGVDLDCVAAGSVLRCETGRTAEGGYNRLCSARLEEGYLLPKERT